MSVDYCTVQTLYLPVSNLDRPNVQVETVFQSDIDNEH